MPSEPVGGRGRVLGLDIGQRRIGVAVSDELRLVASPLTTLPADASGREQLRALIDEIQPVLLVVGLPVTLRGLEGAQAQATRRLVEELRPSLPCPVVFWDERLTSLAAERTLGQMGVKGKRRRQLLDAVAAALLLQSYLDAQRRQGAEQVTETG